MVMSVKAARQICSSGYVYCYVGVCYWLNVVSSRNRERCLWTDAYVYLSVSVAQF